MANVKLFEHRSIDYVPLAERHGKVWHLWPVWFSGEAHLATVATGVVGAALGGTFLWMAVAVVLGCALGTFFMAFHSTQGPQLGLPQMRQPQARKRTLTRQKTDKIALFDNLAIFHQDNVIQTAQFTFIGRKKLER